MQWEGSRGCECIIQIYPKKRIDAEAKIKTFCESFELMVLQVFDDSCPSYSLEKFILNVILVFFKRDILIIYLE